MLVNLSDILSGRTHNISEELELELDAISIHGEIQRFVSKSPVSFAATYVEDGKARIDVRFTCSFELNCDRCLRGVCKELAVDYSDYAYAPGLDSEDDGCEFIKDYEIDLEAFILSELLLNWPDKVLCSEDCKGICMVCGQDLNAGECGCDRFVPNPAFAGLSEIFNTDSKEV